MEREEGAQGISALNENKKDFNFSQFTCTLASLSQWAKKARITTIHFTMKNSLKSELLSCNFSP